MFLRKFYLDLIKILNHEDFLKYVKIVSFDGVNLARLDVRDLDISKKIYLCVLPDVFSKNYTLFNKNAVRLLRFRKKFLPNFSVRFETYISHEYRLIRIPFFSKYFDFMKENISEDFTILNKNFRSEDDVFSTYLMLFFLKKHFYHFFSLNFFKSLKENNLTKIHFFFAKIFLKTHFKHKNALILKSIRKYTNWFSHFSDLNKSKYHMLDYTVMLAELYIIK